MPECWMPAARAATGGGSTSANIFPGRASMDRWGAEHRSVRGERQWSQGDLARLLEVSRQTVNAIETEKYEGPLRPPGCRRTAWHGPAE